MEFIESVATCFLRQRYGDNLPDSKYYPHFLPDLLRHLPLFATNRGEHPSKLSHITPISSKINQTPTPFSYEIEQYFSRQSPHLPHRFLYIIGCNRRNTLQIVLNANIIECLKKYDNVNDNDNLFYNGTQRHKDTKIKTKTKRKLPGISLRERTYLSKKNRIGVTDRMGSKFYII